MAGSVNPKFTVLSERYSDPYWLVKNKRKRYKIYGSVGELVDPPASRAGVRKDVWVRVPPELLGNLASKASPRLPTCVLE